MFKKNIIIKLCFIFFLLAPTLCKSDIKIILEGLDSDSECNVRKQFININFNKASYINSDLQKQLTYAIKIGLRPLGYYEPKVHGFFYTKNKESKEPDKLIIQITPGEPVKVICIDINIFGDGKHDFDYQKIINDNQIFIGKRLNHSDYEQLKNKIYSLAISKGYFDANFQNSQLIVIPSLYQSIWKINFDSGKRYIFEKIKFQGNQIKESYLRNISNIHEGEYYHAKSIMELNRRLSFTDWFESISILSDFTICSQKKN